MQTKHYLELGALFLVIFCTSHCSAISCYQCNSFNDEACDDPFRQPENLNDSSAMIDCNTLPPREDGANYTFCRKTIQTASTPDQTTTRVIRSCGFLEEPKLALQEDEDPAALKCYRRIGTHAVELLFCACYADACNAANVNAAGMGAMLLLFIASAVRFY